MHISSISLLSVCVCLCLCAQICVRRVKSLGKAKQADRTSKEHRYKEAVPLFPGFLFRTRYELCNFRIGDLPCSLKGSQIFKYSSICCKKKCIFQKQNSQKVSLYADAIIAENKYFKAVNI